MARKHRKKRVHPRRHRPNPAVVAVAGAKVAPAVLAKSPVVARAVLRRLITRGF